MSVAGRCRRNAVRGFTLMEVMITVFVVAIGLVGLAAMESLALRRINDAHLRGVATLQAYDMAGRMRANRVGVADGHYDAISGTGSTPPDCASQTDPTFCTPADMAQVDQFEWNSANADVLPGGAGTVTGPDANGVYVISVSWKEFEGTGVAVKSFDYDVRGLR